jgi:hypothetical protein
MALEKRKKHPLVGSTGRQIIHTRRCSKKKRISRSLAVNYLLSSNLSAANIRETG